MRARPSRVRCCHPLGSVTVRTVNGKDKLSERSEVKGEVLNLTHNPEKHEFWERADPLIEGGGHTASV